LLDDCRRAGRPTGCVICAYAEDAPLLRGPRDRLIDRRIICARENQPGAIHVTINEFAFGDRNTQRAQLGRRLLSDYLNRGGGFGQPSGAARGHGSPADHQHPARGQVEQ